MHVGHVDATATNASTRPRSLFTTAATSVMENVSSDMEFSADSIADLCTRILVVVKTELLAGGGNARKVSPRQF